MKSRDFIAVIVFCCIMTAGCIQLPGMHILSNTPDPIIGQWIGGEPPASDLHIIFYENQTFVSISFYLNREKTIEYGTWMKKESGYYTTQPVTGETTDWMHDSLFDEIYSKELPQKKYYRYKG